MSVKAVLPKSSSSFLINLFGGVCYISAVHLAMKFYPDIDAFMLFVVSLVSALVPIVLCEILFLKVHLRPHVGLLSKQKPNKERVAIKLLGYYACLLLVMGLYFVIPMYSDDEFYSAFLVFFLPLMIVYIIGGWIYISEFDSRLKDPEDALWHFGNFIMGRWSIVDKDSVLKLLRSVILRGYYIPVMVVYFTINIESMMEGHEVFVSSYMSDFKNIAAYGYVLLKFFVLVYFYLAVMDVLFGLIGYLMTFRVLDSNIRSTEPTFIGWFVCLVCYYPFWETLFLKHFFIDFYEGAKWTEWFSNMPTWSILLWGMLVILSMGLEALTTLTFGIRFSNLTYRGIVTEGPFRFTKHPQYVFKMFNRFFFCMPFLSVYGVLGSIHSMVLFMGICFVYYLRARTEENHLSNFPEYVEYANWINENGVFRFMGKYFPFLIYSEEKAKAGKLF